MPFPQLLGGVGGIRTLDLLSAIQARSQLRHNPTNAKKSYHGLVTLAS
jgi:hypothetical protein